MDGVLVTLSSSQSVEDLTVRCVGGFKPTSGGLLVASLAISISDNLQSTVAICEWSGTNTRQSSTPHLDICSREVGKPSINFY